MIEQMKIGVSIALKGDATTKLKEFRNIVQRTSEAVQTLETRLRPISDRLMRISDQLQKLNPRLRRFYEEINQGSRSLVELNNALKGGDNSFGKFNQKLTLSSQRMSNLSRSARILKDELEGVAVAGGAVAATMAGAGGASVISGARGGRGRGRGGRGHRGGGLHVRSPHFGFVGFSGGAIAAGLGIYGLGKSFSANSEYMQALAQFTGQDLPGGSMQAADSFVMNTHLKGVSNIDLMQALSDASMVTKDFNQAKKLAPLLARIEYAHKPIFGESNPRMGRGDMQSMIRVAEIASGSKDVDKFYPYLDHMVRVEMSSSGRVTGRDFQAMFRGMRGAGMHKQGMEGMDPDFLFYALEPLVQEFGGPSVGRYIAMARNHLMAGRVTTASAEDLMSLGLVKKGGYVPNKIGMMKKLKPGGVVGQDLINTNLMDWFSKVYLPALTSHGITSYQDQMRHVLIDFTNTDATLFTAFLAQMPRIQQSMQANKNAYGITAMVNLADKIPGGQVAQFSAALTNLETAIGRLTAAPMRDGLNFLTSFLTGLTDAVTDYQKLLNTNHPFMDKVARLFDNDPNNAAYSYLSGKNAPSSNDNAFNVKAVKQHPKTAADVGAMPTTIILQVDKNELGRVVADYFDQNLNHLQIQQPNTFMPNMTPIPIGTKSF